MYLMLQNCETVNFIKTTLKPNGKKLWLLFEAKRLSLSSLVEQIGCSCVFREELLVDNHLIEFLFFL